jgi:catechol 2,3-dioxygenase-like lactoylglutathione lyase family enzyme
MSSHDTHNITDLNVSLQGLTLAVADVERSIEFYMKIPGTSLFFHRPGSFALLHIGKGQLGLLKKGVGPTHLEFDTYQPDALYQHLKETGFSVEEPPVKKGWGEYDFVIHDPDGYCLEFNLPHNDA